MGPAQRRFIRNEKESKERKSNLFLEAHHNETTQKFSLGSHAQATAEEITNEMTLGIFRKFYG
jgi:hypothetical protein